jgi:hypothetical protein
MAGRWVEVPESPDSAGSHTRDTMTISRDGAEYSILPSADPDSAARAHAQTFRLFQVGDELFADNIRGGAYSAYSGTNPENPGLPYHAFSHVSFSGDTLEFAELSPQWLSEASAQGILEAAAGVDSVQDDETPGVPFMMLTGHTEALQHVLALAARTPGAFVPARSVRVPGSGAPPGFSRPLRLRIPATANLYAAGHATAPAPGGGGPGTMPPVIALPAGQRVSVLVACDVGSVRAGPDPWGWGSADGKRVGRFTRTDVTSWGGVSGVIHRNAVLFLAGVFLSDREPGAKAPQRLEYGTGATPDTLAEYAPALGQVFFVGDGRTDEDLQAFRAPRGATRLYLGFVDAAVFGNPSTPPGFYDDNEGSLSVQCGVVPGPAPERQGTRSRGAGGAHRMRP